MSLPTARFIKGGFKVGQLMVYLAEIGKLKIMQSRELPPIPSSVKVIKDSASGYFLSFIVEVLRKTDNLVGIDLGIRALATVGTPPLCNDAKKIHAPKSLKKPMLEVPKTK